MTLRSICNKWIDKLEMRRIAGDDDIVPLLPIISLDLVLDMYTKVVSKLELNQECVDYRNDWSAAYHTINNFFFDCLNGEEKGFFLDKMDELEEYIEHDLKYVKIELKKTMTYYDEGAQDVLSTLCMCNIFSKSAQVYWGMVFMHPVPVWKNGRKRIKFVPNTSKSITTIERCSDYISNHYIPLPVDIEVNVKPVHDAMQVVWDKIGEWAKNEMKIIKEL